MNTAFWMRNLRHRIRGWREELAARGLSRFAVQVPLPQLLGGLQPFDLSGVPRDIRRLAGLGGPLTLTSTLHTRVRRASDDHLRLDDPRLQLPGALDRLLSRGWSLAGQVLYSPGCPWESYGLVSRRVVTNDGVAFIVDAFQNLVELEAMNAHAIGTNSTAAAQTDTALGTEVETRVTGTQSEPASNQYRTTGTQTATAQRLLREHGVFNSTTVSGSKLLDRHDHALITLEISDSIQNQYTLTVAAGG